MAAVPDRPAPLVRIVGMDPEELVPHLRSFRALRFRPERVGDLRAVISPPYDVISAAEQRKLLARSERNVVRLDLPPEQDNDEPDARYRRAARTLAEWRSDGTLFKDPRPAIYVYEQRYRVPGANEERGQRGFLARVRLEPFGPESGILPHERTLAGPREDRYRLLRATGVNTSPVVGLQVDPSGTVDGLLASTVGAPPEIDITDDDGTRHMLWLVPDVDEGDSSVASALAAAGRGPITIADGHHRYETALRYRDERRMSRSCEEDPAFDYVLMLLLDPSRQRLTVLATHRVVLGLGDDGVDRLCRRLDELFETRPMTRAELVETFGGPAGPGGGGRFGLWLRSGGFALAARRPAFEPLLGGGEAFRRLDVALLGTALERIAGIGPAAVAEGRIAFTKSASEAVEQVEAGTLGADAAFLLEPTPVGDVIAVATEGGLMPQKSTYFYPKAATGLVLNPHEW
jgi:uncharacterized protein (DUF1015 family)